MVAQACLGTLLHLDESIAETGLEKYPLAEYAAEHWIGHSQFEGVSGKIQDGMKRLFDPRNRHFPTWLSIYDPLRGEPRSNWLEYISQDSEKSLHYAAFCGIHDVINFLVVERSQDANSRGLFFEDTLLGLACSRAHFKVAQVLLELDVDKETRCATDSSPLDHATDQGAVDVVRLLLDHGANVNAHGKKKNTSLHWASRFGKADVVRVLLERGADVNPRNIENSTPLHDASGGGYVETSRVLLENSSEVDAQNSRNETPLHLASQGGYLDLSRLLLRYNADVHALDSQGETPFQKASKGGYEEIMRLLLEHGSGGSKDAITVESGGVDDQKSQ
jgi:ankyrin repeat protein